MPPIDPPHANTVDRLTVMLAARLAGVAHLRVQGPIHLDDYNEPQPDLTVMRFRDDYSRQHPTPADVLLAIEVADTSLRYDRDEKMPRYGAAGIPEAWLVDVQAGTITVFTEASCRRLRSRASRDPWTGNHVLGRGRPALAGRRGSGIALTARPSPPFGLSLSPANSPRCV